ncbi:MAG: MBL fold metallo-hydrolase [Flavobacteriaceae bacterium]|nr:MAG: MBL fold metallo-hydrolase [Flavobacteriaceae bacterium]
MGKFQKFNIGSLECIALYDSEIELPFHKVFPTAKSSILKKVAPTIQMGFNYLFIKSDKYNVLIDTGRGNGELLNSIEEAGVFLSSIDYIILTHCDADHVSGLQQYAMEDRRLKAFRQTKVIMPKRMWNLWTKRASKQKLIKEFENTPFIKNSSEEKKEVSIVARKRWANEHLPNLKNKISLEEEEKTFLGIFKFIYAPGHRSDHFAILIESEGEHLLHIADAFRHSSQITVPKLHSMYDSYPQTLYKTIQELYNLAKTKKAVIFGTHFPFPGLFEIKENEVLYNKNF